MLQLVHAGAEAHPQASQPASQQLFDFFLKSFANNPPPRLFLPPQPLSQPPSQPHGSQPISQPQLGPLPQPQGSQLVSQPQLGSAPHPQADSQPQVGSQQLSQLLFLHMPSSLASSSCSGRRRGLLHPESQPQGSQLVSQPQLGPIPQPQGSQLVSQPQLGPAPQADSHPQDGSQQPLPQAVSHPQVGSQQPLPQAVSHPQLGSAEHPVSQQALSQPDPFSPSIRSSNPPPKLGALMLMQSMRDPITMFNFIEPQLPNTMNQMSGAGLNMGVFGRDRFRHTKSPPKSPSCQAGNEQAR